MPSLQHAAILALFRLTRRKQRYAGREALLVNVRKRRAKAGPQPPRPLAGLEVSRDDSLGFPVFTVAPLQSEQEGTQRIGMYLHGGAHVNDLRPQHWTFVAEVVRRTGIALIVPQYPLAPEHTWLDSFEPLLGLAADQLGNAPLLIGDSAGGGYALALAQKLRGAGRTPKGVLISPWLDATLEPPPDAISSIAIRCCRFRRRGRRGMRLSSSCDPRRGRRESWIPSGTCRRTNRRSRDPCGW
jgi:acetyl esterase/lipase